MNSCPTSRQRSDLQFMFRFAQRSLAVLIVYCAVAGSLAFAQGSPANIGETKELNEAPLASVEAVQQSSPPQASPHQPPQPEKRAWQYGGFADIGYLRDFNDPTNDLFRSRGTTFHVNEWDVNMAGAYLPKQATQPSDFGFLFSLHPG